MVKVALADHASPADLEHSNSGLAELNVFAHLMFEGKMTMVLVVIQPDLDYPKAAHTRLVLVVSKVMVCAGCVHSLIAPAVVVVVAATILELVVVVVTAYLQALQQPWVAFQAVANVEEWGLDLVHKLDETETEKGHPESHCVELAGVKDEARDEDCCCCCCIGLERCFLADVLVVHCDYSSQKASGEKRGRSRKGGIFDGRTKKKVQQDGATKTGMTRVWLVVAFNFVL